MSAILSIEYFFLQRVIQQYIESIQTPKHYICATVYEAIFPAVQIVISGAPNDGFLLNALKTLFSPPRVRLDL